MLSLSFFALSVLLLFLSALACPRKSHAFARKRRKPVLGPVPHRSGLPAKKPEWVPRTVLQLHEEQPALSHRKLADAFNLLYFAAAGVSVGRTWVRDLLKKQACEALHQQQVLKHRVPKPGNHATAYGASIRRA